jgi:hypothetical protein
MATTNEILSEIAAYTAANGRPCPAKHLTDKFGDDALALIAALKKEGKVYGKRGRTGGLVSNEASTPVVEKAEIDSTGNDLAAEFAALAEKLAEASDAGPEAAVG